MSNKQNQDLQYSTLCEQGDLGLWETPLKAEDNKKMNKEKNIEESKKD